MTPKLLKDLKGVNFSCTSPASTTIEQQQYSMLVAFGSSGRAIDRFSPHLRDPLRTKSLNPELPLQPSSKPKSVTPHKKVTEKSKSPSRGEVLVSPATSSRYLLSESAPEDLLGSSARRFEPAKVQEWTRFQPIKAERTTTMTTTTRDECIRPSSCSASTSRPQNQQVVVLRVSLHCKGCEAKVRKHITKMEGVTSFTTDLVNKKVTVTGDVTPLGVLNSISKVKNAQLWRSS